MSRTGIDEVVKVLGVTLIWGEEEGSFVDILKLRYLYPHTWRPRRQ